jgi:hypothetical protein
MEEVAAVTYGPQPGDIFITTIHGQVGAGIGLAEDVLQLVEHVKKHMDTKWRHAGVYVGDGMVVEAEPGGARLAALSQYDTDPMLWVPCPEQYRTGVAAAARTLEGVPYSYLDYDAVTMHALHIPAPGLKGYIADSGHMMCSQLADHAALMGGWHLFDDGRWEGYVTPIDLAVIAP